MIASCFYKLYKYMQMHRHLLFKAKLQTNKILEVLGYLLV